MVTLVSTESVKLKASKSIQTEFFCIRGQHECEKDARFDYILRSDAEAREAVIIVA